MEYDAWLHWIVTENCNLQCDYCFTPRLNRERAPKIDIPRLIESLNRTGKIFKVTFTGGGEPFVVSNLVEAIVELTKKHYVGINTNLTYPRVRRFAEFVDPARVDYVHASCHIKELERVGLVEQFIENFHLLKDKGFVVYVAEVAHPSLLPGLEQHRERFRSQGIELLFSKFLGTYEGRRYPDEYTEEELEAFFKQPVTPIRMMRRENVHRTFSLPEAEISPEPAFTNVRGKLCNAGYNAAVVYSNAQVVRCADIPQPLGDIYSGFTLDEKVFICPKDCCGCPLKSYDMYLYNKAADIYVSEKTEVQRR